MTDLANPKDENENENENEFGLFYWWKSGVVWKMVVLCVDSDQFLKIGQTCVSIGNDVSMINRVYELFRNVIRSLSISLGTVWSWNEHRWKRKGNFIIFYPNWGILENWGQKYV